MLRSHAEDAKVVFCYSARAVEMHHRMHEKTAEALMLMTEVLALLRSRPRAASASDGDLQQRRRMPARTLVPLRRLQGLKPYVRVRRRALLFGNLPQPPIKYEVAAGASDKAVAGATGRAK